MMTDTKALLERLHRGGQVTAMSQWLERQAALVEFHQRRVVRLLRQVVVAAERVAWARGLLVPGTWREFRVSRTHVLSVMTSPVWMSLHWSEGDGPVEEALADEARLAWRYILAVRRYSEALTGLERGVVTLGTQAIALRDGILVAANERLARGRDEPVLLPYPMRRT